MALQHEIIEFEEKQRSDVVHLWETCELTRPWNDPDRDIDRVLQHEVGKLFILKRNDSVNDKVLGSVMVGYDGHRGSVYYLAVHPDFQKQDLGRILMDHSENYLRSLGCPKLNLNIRTTNLTVIEFYDRLGYLEDEVVTMSKRLITDEKQDQHRQQ